MKPTLKTNALGLPVVSTLPGLAGTEWPDATLLKFICQLMVKYQQELRSRLAPLVHGRHVVELREALQIAANVTGMTREQLASPDVELQFPNINGLGAERRVSVRDILVELSCLLYDVREQIQKVFIAKDGYPERALCWAQALVMCEGVMARGGFETDYDNVDPRVKPPITPLERLALKATVVAARIGLAEEFRMVGGAKAGDIGRHICLTVAEKDKLSAVIAREFRRVARCSNAKPLARERASLVAEVKGAS